MTPSNKLSQPNIIKGTLNFKSLIAKDLSVIETFHESIVGRMMKEEIPSLPNLGMLDGIYDAQFEFLGLSGLKKRYGDAWPVIAKTLSEYLNQKGGKRLRPLLLLNGYRAFSHGEEPNQEILGAAVGLELLHETALFLDDIVDNSILRRGAPSLWKKIEDVPELAALDGKRVAADLGSLVFSWARHLMVDEVPDKIKDEIDRIFYQAVNDMKQGQDDDGRLARGKEWPSLEHILEQFYLKTASYSIRLPLLFALNVSPTIASGNISKEIENFSRGFGLAFQLHDDLLITRTSEEIGKDSNTDILNGTKIPLAILARKLGSKDDKKFIDKVWGNPRELNPENLSKLKEIFKKSGAIKKIIEMTEIEIKRAESALEAMTKSGFDVSPLQYLLNIGLPWMNNLTKEFT